MEYTKHHCTACEFVTSTADPATEMKDHIEAEHPDYWKAGKEIGSA